MKIKLVKTSDDPEKAKRLARNRLLRRRKRERNAVGRLSRIERRAMVDAWCKEHNVITQPFVPDLMVSATSAPFARSLGGRRKGLVR